MTCWHTKYLSQISRWGNSFKENMSLSRSLPTSSKNEPFIMLDFPQSAGRSKRQRKARSVMKVQKRPPVKKIQRLIRILRKRTPRKERSLRGRPKSMEREEMKFLRRL